MKLESPYPDELLRVAQKAVWFDPPERTLADVPTFLAHLMVYGSPADISVVERWVPDAEFRKALQDAPAGVFTEEAWRRWQSRFELPPPDFPRRRFPDGSRGPEAGKFFGR